jgi:putative flippase GtrA
MAIFYNKQFRFLLGGGLNTVVGYGTYALLIYLGVFYVMAQTISTVAGVTNSYFWNKYFTFKQPRKSLAEVVRFVSVYLLSYLLSVLILFVCIDKLFVSAYIAGLIGLVFTTVISYVGHNHFSFRNDIEDSTKTAEKTPDIIEKGENNER